MFWSHHGQLTLLACWRAVGKTPTRDSLNAFDANQGHTNAANSRNPSVAWSYIQHELSHTWLLHLLRPAIAAYIYRTRRQGRHTRFDRPYQRVAAGASYFISTPGTVLQYYAQGLLIHVLQALFTMSSAQGTAPAGYVLPEKKRRFSLFRKRSAEPMVTILPVDGSSNASDSSPRTLVPTSPTPTEASSSSSHLGSARSSPSLPSDTLPLPRTQRAPSLSQVLEDAQTPCIVDFDADALPTYASVAHPTQAVTYGFIRSSPFAMVVSPEGTHMDGSGLYHISVGVNVWMPSMTVTTVRRGTNETGPIVASVELGISSSPATVTMGQVCRPLNEVYFRKSTTSSTRLYFLGDGRAIKWKMSLRSWQAHCGSTLLATFIPTPPRKVTVEPAGHKLLDHLMVSLIILMREHLTPLAGMRGDSAQLFNYSPHYSYRED